MANGGRIGRPFDSLDLFTSKQEVKEAEHDLHKAWMNRVEVEKKEFLRKYLVKIGLDPNMPLSKHRKIVAKGNEYYVERERARKKAVQREREKRILRRPINKNLAKKAINYNIIIHHRQQNIHQKVPEAAPVGILRNRQAIEANRERQNLAGAIEVMANLNKRNAQLISASAARNGELQDIEEEEEN